MYMATYQMSSPSSQTPTSW